MVAHMRQIFVGCFVRGGKKWHGMLCPGMFCPAPKNNSSIVLTVIHTFGAVIEQLSLAIEIMVKCNHVGSSNKRVKGS